MKPILSTALLLLAAACANNAVKVTDVWFDERAPFHAMKSFAVEPIATSVEVDEPLARGVEAAIREHLTRRGYVESADAPDFTVATTLEMTTMFYGGSAARERAAGVSFSIAHAGHEVWRSTGSALAPDKTVERNERIRQTVDTTLMRFPPQPEDD